MTAISTAIGSERRSRVLGYKLNRLFSPNVTVNLPQQIVIMAEANTANQASITTAKLQITNAAQAAKTYGYGSPIHQIARILFPVSGDGVGGIPVIVMPQLAAVGATATTNVWTITGPATASVTHYIRVNGRYSLDGQNYAVNIVIGDTATQIAQKYADVINAVLGAPVTATVAAGVLTLTTKWKSITSADLETKIDINGNSAGVTYALVATAGTGVADITDALAQFEDNWYTTVINSYGAAQFATLEAFNGIPDDETPTGRYEGRIFKPFLAFFGSTLNIAADLVAITNAAGRVNQVTNVLCPAPKSEGMAYEAAANMVAIFCRVMQDNPQLDVSGQYYPDMPVPMSATGDIASIGDMGDYNNRDLLVKAGCSTVLLANGAYQVQDLVSTYHPTGENPLQYNYARNLNLDWNVAFGYKALEVQFLQDHVIVRDDQVTQAKNAIKPKEWKALVYQYADDLSARALINDPQYSKDSLLVEIDPDNPNRFNSNWSYKRTGTVRIASTDVNAGF